MLKMPQAHPALNAASELVLKSCATEEWLITGEPGLPRIEPGVLKVKAKAKPGLNV
jgi:hypothetical protein